MNPKLIEAVLVIALVATSCSSGRDSGSDSSVASAVSPVSASTTTLAVSGGQGGATGATAATSTTTGCSPTSYPQCQLGVADAFSQTGRPEESSNIVNEFPELEWETATRNWEIKAGTGDPSGCADGSENRSDHTTASAGVARKQNPAPAFTASTRTDTSVPPNDADGGSMVCTFCYNIGV